MAAAVSTLAAADRHQVIAAEGQTLASWLRTVAGCTVSDERTLVLVAQRLAHLPTVHRWLADGDITWSVARSIVFATRRLTIAQLGWVDVTLAGDAERVLLLDGDGVIGVAERLAGDARPDLEADRERRLFDRRHLQVQTGLDGSVQVYGEFDAEMGAAILEALDTTPTAASRPDDAPPATSGPGETHEDVDHRGSTDPRHTDAHGRPSTPRRSRGQQRADALHALCLQRRAASNGAGDDNGVDGWRDAAAADGDQGRDCAEQTDDAARPVRSTGGASASAPSSARPSLLVLMDIAVLAGIGNAQAGVQRITELLWRTSRGPIRLSLGAAERLTCHGDLRLVLMDGAVPLGVGSPTTNVGAPLRAALLARDGTCRFPSCQAAGESCDNHHIVHRLHGGPTVLENLALLCPAHHRAVHEGGWRVTLNDDATMTFRRRGRELTTVPFAEHSARPTRPPPHGRPRRVSRAGPNAESEPPTLDEPPDGTTPPVDAPLDAAGLPF